MRRYASNVLRISIAALLLAGCATDRSPIGPETTPTPEWAEVTSPSQDTSQGLLGDLLGGLLRFVFDLVSPDESATLRSGRFTLDIPVGALGYEARYGIGSRASGPVEAELAPHGAEFLNPVEFEVDLSGTSLANAPDVTLYWWDPEAEEWIDVGGVWNPSTRKLTSTLEHFSRYRPGRAGW